MMLECAFCRKSKPEKEFTRFERNPALKDRNGRTSICRECCSEYIESNGNTKEALKEILRLQDIPYVEKYAQTAFETYEKKRKNTNVVIKKNLFDEKEEIQGVESIPLQTTIYTCYTSRLGVMPKKYVNFSFSDGIRSEDEDENKETSNDNSKAVKSAIKYLVKQYTQEIFDDKDLLKKAVKISFDEFDLYKNNATKRQQKYKLKCNITTLIDAEILVASDYLYMFDDVKNTSKKQEEIVLVEETSKNDDIIDVPHKYDMKSLKIKWGEDYKEKDIVKFENKYSELIKNYEIKTSAHDEFLRHACIASVRANECMAKNDVDGAKTWMGIFKDVTSAGKLQPSQMSKADLSGGLNNFGEFWKTVEQSKNILSVLPEMYESPRDKADFVIYCLIQYVRRVKSLPDIDYKDVYKFYEEMESQFIDADDGEIDVEDFWNNGREHDDVPDEDEGDS